MIMKKIIMASMAGIILLAAGCHILGGGGWLPGLNGGKAHFGFEVECVEEDDTYYFHEGDFQFMDKSAGVRFHGEVTWSLGLGGEYSSCEEAAVGFFTSEDLMTAQFSGACRTQPKGYEGTFTVYVEDNGTPGMAGDYIEISTIGCGEDGGDYEHAGVLGGGNIWFEEHSD
jgi:hypothetical protein